MPLSTLLAVAGLVAFALGGLALIQLMPKLRSRERRGEISSPVPDPHDSQLAGARLLGLIWSVKTSAERPRFRRHVMLVRWLPVVGAGLLVSSAFAMPERERSTAEAVGTAPPSVTISLAAESEPVAR